MAMPFAVAGRSQSLGGQVVGCAIRVAALIEEARLRSAA